MACKKTHPQIATDQNDDNGCKNVMGKATDTKGNPIASARITVDNTLYYNSVIPGKTDANGNYKIAVPIGA